jgi:hypothetical protein
MYRLRHLDASTVRLGVLGLVILAALIFAGIKIFGGDDSSSNNGSGPEGLSQSALVSTAADAGHTVYWVGPNSETEQYEYTRTEDGRVYVRYLNNGAPVGDPRPDFLTVGTYEVPDAKAALETSASQSGAKVQQEDGFDLLKGTSGQNVYVVFDDQADLQIEIFHPTPGQALKFAKSGDLQPVS